MSGLDPLAGDPSHELIGIDGPAIGEQRCRRSLNDPVERWPVE
jgi:hypothetical protein